jgi:CRP-like cAMP-binding protein
MDNKIHLFDRVTTTRQAKAGEVIFERGEAGAEMFVIRVGTIKIMFDDILLDTLTAGDIFGEMSLIDHCPRSATAVAETDSILVPVNAARFNFMVQETPNFAQQVMAVLVDRLRRHHQYLLPN